jgi:type I restriction enzyme S subunit
MFNQKTEKMLEALITISLENSRLIALRDWLLPMLMNGQATIAD